MALGAKSFTYDASTADPAGFMAQIFNHFNTAAEYWTLETGSDGDAIVLINSADSSMRLSIRRQGIASLETLYDPGNGSLSPGSASSGPSGATSEASPEVSFDTAVPEAPSTRFFITELPDAVIILLQNGGKQYAQAFIMAGRILQPLRTDYPSLGMAGDAVFAGRIGISNSSTYVFGSGGSAANVASKVKAGDGWYGAGITFPSSHGAVKEANGTIKYVVGPALIQAGESGGGVGSSTTVGLTKYFGLYPTTSLSGQGDAPNRTLYSGTDDAWLAVDDSATTTKYLISWEKNKPLS